MISEEKLVEKIDHIIDQIDSITELLSARRRAPDTKQALEEAILDVLKAHSDLWLQPKEFPQYNPALSEFGPQSIGSACSRLVFRGQLEVRLKSETTQTRPGKHEYDPKVYRLKTSPPSQLVPEVSQQVE